jgi:hypothetical protein
MGAQLSKPEEVSDALILSIAARDGHTGGSYSTSIILKDSNEKAAP